VSSAALLTAKNATALLGVAYGLEHGSSAIQHSLEDMRLIKAMPYI
jgi:hypothetical protein